MSCSAPGRDDLPASTGNGYIGTRVPWKGSGWDTSPVPVECPIAGVYGREDGRDVRVSLPAWSAIAFSDGCGWFGASEEPGWLPRDDERVEDYHQKVSFRDGSVETEMAVVSGRKRRTRWRTIVLPDRFEPHRALVEVEVVPSWSGTLSIVSYFDQRALRLLSSRAVTVGIDDAALTQELEVGGARVVLAALLTAGGERATLSRPAAGTWGEAAIEITIEVEPGRTYRVAKLVGIASSSDTGQHMSEGWQELGARARSRAGAAAELGAERIKRCSTAAWEELWRADLAVPGDREQTRRLRACLFYLLTSVRDDVTWSVSPLGLSSSLGWGGRVFWDAETWIYPALLPFYPKIAAALAEYRVQRAPAAASYARATGYRGMRFPWESATDGSEQGPNPWARYELHITADVGLALWQYYLATADSAWLARAAWPVLVGVARFWASVAVANEDGSYSIRGVMGPDEYRWPVEDNAYTNLAAAAALRIATRAAEVLGETPDGEWAATADRLRVPTIQGGCVIAEDASYDGQQIKQADALLVFYPLGDPALGPLASATLDYYRERADRDGPAMTAAIAGIVAARCGRVTALDDSVRESIEPFLSGPFYQLSETRALGRFTFLTGAGAYLQLFVQGVAGLRWGARMLELAPVLPSAVPALVVRGLRWRGRIVDLEIDRQTTTVTLREGEPMVVSVHDTVGELAMHAPLSVACLPPRAH